MTAQEFIAKYPDTKPNTNCLQDMACPHCGSRGPFRIDTSTMTKYSDDGTIDQYGDSEYDGGSYCACDHCDENGTVEDFTIEGLDELLTEKEKHEHSQG